MTKKNDLSTVGQLKQIVSHERPRILAWADDAMARVPASVTAYPCPRSPGSPNDYYSEAPYKWPNPQDPAAPYVSRDGEAYPGRFTDHQRAISRLNTTVGALTAKRLITADPACATHAVAHLRAWFVDPQTRMNPSLTYAQAQGNICTGSPYGIIDAKHLTEVIQAIQCLAQLGIIEHDELDQLRQWFRELMRWLNTHPLGQRESESTNNHGIYWTLLVAACATFVDDHDMLAHCRDRFRDRYVGQQMAEDGSFPREINRTRPMGYSIFALNGMVMLSRLLTTADENLWTYTTPDGRGIERAVAYLYTFLADTSTWPHRQDIDDFHLMPGRPIALLLAGLIYSQQDYLDLWQSLEEPDPDHDWHNRAVCFRQPILWLPITPDANGCD